MRVKIFLLLCVFTIAFSSVSFAVDIGSKDLQFDPVWYKPQILASSDITRSVLTNLISVQKFSTWSGYIVSKVDYDKYGIRFYATNNNQQDNVAINLTKVNGIYLYNLPNLDRDFKWLVMITLSQAADNQYFRVSDPERAKELIDVIFTLSIAAGSKMYTPTGLNFYFDDKEIEKFKKDMDWNNNYGAFVNIVEANSPAAIAGFKHNDIIVEINGDKVKDASGFGQAIQNGLEGKENAQFNVKIYRNKTILDLTIDVPNFNYGKEKLLLDSNQQNLNPKNKVSFGIDVKPITYSLDNGETYKGIQVLGVKPNSLAEESGIKVGDIILEINDLATPDLSSMASILSNAAPVKLKILRDNKIITLETAQSF